MKKHHLYAVAVVSIIGMIALTLESAAPARAAAPETVKFTLDFMIVGPYAPYFLAIERGFFADEGLTIEIIEGKGGTEALKLIAQGSYPVGIVSYSVMMRGVEQGMSVQGVFGVYQTNPMAVHSHADKPIRAPQDLAGKIIAGPATISAAQLFPVLLKVNGIDPNNLTINHVPTNAQAAVLLQRQCDGMLGNIQDRLLYEQQGMSITTMRYADFGVNPLAQGIVVNREYLTSHAATVKGFVRAVSKGFAAAQQDPEAAVDALLKHYPDRQAQRAAFLGQLKLVLTLLHSPRTQDQPLGWTAREDWEETQKLLLDAGLITQTLPLETYYTNDYIPTAE